MAFYNIVSEFITIAGIGGGGSEYSYIRILAD